MRFQKNPNPNDDEEDMEIFGFKFDKDIIDKISNMTDDSAMADPDIAAMVKGLSDRIGAELTPSDIVHTIKEIAMSIAKATAEVINIISETCTKLLHIMSLMGEDVSMVTMPLNPSIHLWFKDGIKSDKLYYNINEFTFGDHDSRDRKDIYIEVYPGSGPENFGKLSDAIFGSN